MTRITVDPDGLKHLLEHAKAAGTVYNWCSLALEFATEAHKQGQDLAKLWNDPKAIQARLEDLMIKNPPVEASQRLVNWIEVFSRLTELTSKQLVNLALEHLSESVSNRHYEQVIEELCTRVYPGWCKEDPALPPVVEEAAPIDPKAWDKLQLDQGIRSGSATDPKDQK